MNYQIIKNYRTDDKLRNSFNALAETTFGLNFETWYQSGYWNEKYIPYSILAEDKIISNVSVNLIDCELNGQAKHYIQLGTVMTEQTHRNKGYSRMLMEEIMRDYFYCDGFFLYANDSVVDFYPKFGFEKADEFRYRAVIHTDKENTAVTVPMTNAEEWANFLKEKNNRKSCGIIKTDTDDLLMFYLTQFMSENIYYVKEYDCYVIAETDSGTLTVYDVFASDTVDLLSVCECFGKDIAKVEFAFTPENTDGLEKYNYTEEDTTFFILGDGIKQDLKTISAFPALTHA